MPHLLRRLVGLVKKTPFEESIKTRLTKKHLAVWKPEFIDSTKTTTRELVGIRQAIDKNFEKLKLGEKITEKRTGATIEKARTGKVKGAHNEITLRVSFRGKMLFVKVSVEDPIKIIQRQKKAAKLLSIMGNTYNGFNLRIIEPHLVYGTKLTPSRKSTSRVFQVTDFFDSKKVTMCNDYKGAEAAKLIETTHEMQQKMGILELNESTGVNSFYDKTTRTIYFFDV